MLVVVAAVFAATVSLPLVPWKKLTSQPDKRLEPILVFLILTGLIMTVVSSALPTSSVFDASALTYRLLPPVIFGLAVNPVRALLAGRMQGSGVPLLVGFLMLIALLSVPVGLLNGGAFPRSIVDLTALSVFMASLTIGGYVGLHQAADLHMLRSLTWTIALMGLLCLAVGVEPSPFDTFVLPGGCVVAVAGVQLRDPRVFLFGSAIAAVRLVNTPTGAQSPRLQLIACIGLTIFLVIYRRVTILAWVPLFAMALFVVGKSVAGDLLLGTYEGSDISLAERSFEARAVQEQVLAIHAAIPFGRGVGSTVDLSGAPDYVTLLQSGRDLAHVPTIHLLPYHIFLKLGVAGLVWGTMLVVAFIRSVLDDGPLRFLTLFVVAGFVDAFTAGGHLFTNPLPPLVLGYLLTQRSAGLAWRLQDDQAEGGMPSVTGST
jgi:hypothetical protein